MKFDLNYLHNEQFQSFYGGEHIKEVINTQFVCLEIDKYKNWKNRTVHILPKSSSACYAIRCTYNFSNTEKIKMINYAYLPSIMKHAQYFGVILWTLEGSLNRKKDRERIMVAVNSRSSCRTIFKAFKMLTIASQYMY